MDAQIDTSKSKDTFVERRCHERRKQDSPLYQVDNGWMV